MSHLELRAQMTVRPGQLVGFTAQAAELMRLTRELDTHTLRYDWFVSEDGTRCEVHEAYESEQGLFEPRHGGFLNSTVEEYPIPVNTDIHQMSTSSTSPIPCSTP